MARQPSDPIGRDHLEMPCIWLPDDHDDSARDAPSDRLTRAREASVPFGGDRVEIRCIWIPDGYEGPRPGYPWIEVGTMILPAETKPVRVPNHMLQPGRAVPGDPTEPTARDAVSAPYGESAASAGPGNVSGIPDDGVAAAKNWLTSPADPGYPDIGAAMKAWDALSDPRATLAALGAAVKRNAAGRTIADRNPGSYQVAADLSGYATYYNLPGSTTASGQPFDPNSMSAAMTRDRAPPGTNVQVRLQSDPSTAVTVQVNDTGPFARDADGRPLRPLRPDPNIIIDLTPRAFDQLTNNNRQLGRVPVIVSVPDHD